jgi:hypothetical protein
LRAFYQNLTDVCFDDFLLLDRKDSDQSIILQTNLNAPDSDTVRNNFQKLRNSPIKNNDGYYLGTERELAAGWLVDDRRA